jgi:hypothetical protein
MLGQAFFNNKFYERPRPVPALLDLAAVGIEYPVAKINPRHRRFFNNQYLISANAKATVSDIAPLIAGEINGLVDRIDHHEIIASTVHFCESKCHASSLFVSQREYRTRLPCLRAVF